MISAQPSNVITYSHDKDEISELIICVLHRPENTPFYHKINADNMNFQGHILTLQRKTVQGLKFSFSFYEGQR